MIQTVIADFTVRSEEVLRRNLRGAGDVVREVLARSRSSSSSSPGPAGHGQENDTTTGTGTTATDKRAGTGVLLHIFSNGGCHLAIQLAHLFLSSSSFGGQGQAIPVSLQILDSCPGSFSISQTYGAAVHSVPRHHPWVLQQVEKWGLWGAVAVIAGLQGGLPRGIGEDVIRKRLLGGAGVDFEGMRREVLDERIWGGDGDSLQEAGKGKGGGKGGKETETGRLYLYSEADEAVSCTDVERHVRLARKMVRERYKGRGLARGEVEDEVKKLVRAERFE